MNDYYEHCSKEGGLHSYKKGKDYYRKILTNTVLGHGSPELIHEFGKRELKKITKELQRINIQKPKSPYTEKKQVIDELKKIQTKIKIMNQHLFDKELKDYQIKSIPQENQHMTAYYVRPTIHKDYGTFYINTSQPSYWNPYELMVLSLHEGFPGHHYEISYHRDEVKPRYMELWSSSSYSEGWAFYAESLYPYKEDEYYYYKLQYDLLRTLRLLVDTGIHYYGWNYDTCFQLMKKHCSLDDQIIHKELIRYYCLPGQAVSYKIGGITIMYLRKLCLQRGYSVKQFHTLILSMGPCSLDELIKNITQLLEN